MNETLKRQFEGEVTSDKMSKTIVVRVTRTTLHPRYGKRYLVAKKYKVHDEKETAGMGDLVRFEECRPLSRDKRWRIVEILKVAPKSVDIGVDEAVKEAMTSAK